MGLLVGILPRLIGVLINRMEPRALMEVSGAGYPLSAMPNSTFSPSNNRIKRTISFPTASNGLSVRLLIRKKTHQMWQLLIFLYKNVVLRGTNHLESKIPLHAVPAAPFVAMVFFLLFSLALISPPFPLLEFYKSSR